MAVFQRIGSRMALVQAAESKTRFVVVHHQRPGQDSINDTDQGDNMVSTAPNANAQHVSPDETPIIWSHDFVPTINN